MSQTHNSSGLYRPDIDGLRAVSVIAVVLFHTGLAFPGGYVGVDAFFVISGFLITNIIQSSLDRGDFSLTAFWARRVRRILPASLAVAILCLFAGSFVLLPYDLHELGEATVAHALSVSNLYHWQQIGDYFGGESELRPLLHTWSLSVEEQFYLAFPLLLLALSSCSPHRRKFALLVFALGSLALSEVVVRQYPHVAFFMLPTRAWELLVGALLSHFRTLPIPSRPIRECLSGIGALSLLAAMLLYSGDTRFPGLHALMPVSGTALLIVAHGAGPVFTGRVLSLKPVVLVGLMSYSIYLWHWPLLLFAKYIFGHTLPWFMSLTIISLSVIASYFSWRYIELPFRRPHPSVSNIRTIVLGISSSLLIGVASLYVVLSDGAPFRRFYFPPVFEDAGFSSSKYFRTKASSVPAELPAIGTEDEPNRPSRLLIWGDSHLPPLAEVLDKLMRARGISGLLAARSASAPVIEVNGGSSEASKWNNAVLALLANGGFSDLLIVSRWSTWLKDESAYNELYRRLKYLRNLGLKISVLKQVPEQTIHVSRAVYNSRLGLPMPPGVTISNHRQHMRISNNYLDQLESIGVQVLDPAPRFFDESGTCKICEGGRAFYRDDDHLSSYGASMLLSPVLEAVIDDIAARPFLSLK